MACKTISFNEALRSTYVWPRLKGTAFLSLSVSQQNQAHREVGYELLCNQDVNPDTINTVVPLQLDHPNHEFSFLYWVDRTECPPVDCTTPTTTRATTMAPTPTTTGTTTPTSTPTSTETTTATSTPTSTETTTPTSTQTTTPTSTPTSTQTSTRLQL